MWSNIIRKTFDKKNNSVRQTYKNLNTRFVVLKAETQFCVKNYHYQCDNYWYTENLYQIWSFFSSAGECLLQKLSKF